MNYDDYNDFDELNYYGHSENRYLTYEEVEKVAASKVRGSILWMVLGLLISGLTGYFTLIGLSNGTIPFLVVPVAFVLEFVAVIAFTALTYKASASVLKMIEYLFAASSSLWSKIVDTELSRISSTFSSVMIVSRSTTTLLRSIDTTSPVSSSTKSSVHVFITLPAILRPIAAFIFFLLTFTSSQRSKI